MNFLKRMFNSWSDVANKELNWYSSDNEQRYQDNLKKHYNDLLKFNWIDNSFTYKFNKYGFRCEEFVDTDNIMFLGCSVTQGIGLPNELIFPNLVAKETKLRCANLAVHGTSADTAFRLATSFADKIKPKIIISVLLFDHRLELLLPDGVQHFTGQWSMVGNTKLDSTYRKNYIEFYEKWMMKPENAFLNYNTNVLALKKYCNTKNIKYINYDSNSFGIDATAYPTKARDLIHPGIEYHQIAANKILKDIQL